MNKQLTPHFQKLENARHAMLGMVNGLPHDKLNKKPAPSNGAIINPGLVQKKSLKEKRREKA